MLHPENKAQQALETSLTIYQSTWCNIQNNLNLQTLGSKKCEKGPDQPSDSQNRDVQSTKCRLVSVSGKYRTLLGRTTEHFIAHNIMRHKG